PKEDIMTDQKKPAEVHADDLAGRAEAFRRRLRTWGSAGTPAPRFIPVELPVAGALAGAVPTDVEGGLQISSWFFRRRLAAIADGGDMALYRSPFDPA